MDAIKAFATQLNFETGVITGAKTLIQRRLSNMHGMYADSAATEQILSKEDRLIYEVYATALPETAANILYCTTIIYPGTVGDEYHMTKGHYHSKRDRGEVYFGLAGQGYLLLQNEDGDYDALPMEAGTIAYVPPYYAHRTLNSGDDPFIFFAAWSGDAGHDYGSIESTGFPQLVVKRDGQPQLIDNPHFV
ncbi:MAG: glucose-6-phosphate isomerase [Aggregatilineales bacterium]